MSTVCKQSCVCEIKQMMQHWSHGLTYMILSFQIPGSLHKLVSDRLTNIVKGKDPQVLTGMGAFGVCFVWLYVCLSVLIYDKALPPFCVLCGEWRRNAFYLSLHSASTYCRRVNGRAYVESKQKTTKEELWALLKTIHENPKLSNKEKRRLLGQFYKGHPEIFVQYFGSRLSSDDL